MMKIHCVLCNANGLAGWLRSRFDIWLVVLFVSTKTHGFLKTSILFRWFIFNMCYHLQRCFSCKSMSFCMDGLLKHLGEDSGSISKSMLLVRIRGNEQTRTQLNINMAYKPPAKHHLSSGKP